jgi:SSS family transporter
LKVTELTIMVVYMLVCVWIGYVYQRKLSRSSQGADEFYSAGRSIGTGVNSLAFMAALGSGGSFLAIAGTTWNLGIPYWAWLVAGGVIGLTLASFLVAKPMRNSQKITLPEFINDRYNAPKFFKVAVPIIIIIGSSMYLVSQMKAGGLITSFVTGLSYQWGLIIIGLVFVLYVSMGGMLAVTWTNVMQGLFMISLTLVCVIGGLMALPVEWSAFFIDATEKNPGWGIAGEKLPVAAYIGGFVTNALAWSVTPHLIMRVFTSTNARSARLSINISMVIYASLMTLPIFFILPFFTTLDAGVLSSNASDMWLLLVVDQYLSPFFMGVVMAGIMAAVMSSTDALLLTISSAVSYDLYKGVIKPDASQKQILRASVIATWVIGIIIILITLNPPEFLIVLYQGALGLMCSSFFGPLVLGIWWKRANTTGAVVGLLAGAISFIIAYLVFDMPYTSEILVGLPISLIAMISASLLTEKPSQQEIEKVEMYHEV